MADCVQNCGNPNCKHERRQHSRHSCTWPGCQCKKTNNDIGQDERRKRERGDRG